MMNECVNMNRVTREMNVNTVTRELNMNIVTRELNMDTVAFLLKVDTGHLSRLNKKQLFQQNMILKFCLGTNHTEKAAHSNLLLAVERLVRNSYISFALFGIDLGAQVALCRTKLTSESFL